MFLLQEGTRTGRPNPKVPLSYLCGCESLAGRPAAMRAPHAITLMATGLHATIPVGGAPLQITTPRVTSLSRAGVCV